MRNWTYNEVLLALYAYCHVPFNKASNSHPWIVKIANAINRSPAAVKMKIGNLGTFDLRLKEKGIVGLTKTSKIDNLVWNDYAGNWHKLAYDAEKLLSEQGDSIITDLHTLPIGSEKYYLAKSRINQTFFRSAVLSSYNNQCCISGVSEPSMLEAAHIISWIDNEALRTEPTNGLCLNPLFHRAFDKYLLAISPDLKIHISEKLISSVLEDTTLHYLRSLQGRSILSPSRFPPSLQNLSLHYEQFKRRQ